MFFLTGRSGDVIQIAGGLVPGKPQDSAKLKIKNVKTKDF